MAARQPRAGWRARCRVRDWADYDRALTRRGDITVRIAPDAIAGWRAAAGRRSFSAAAITAALMVRAVFRLPLRQAAGRIAFVFRLLGLDMPVPDRTTLSRRGRVLPLEQRIVARGRLDLAIDSTGLRVARPRGADPQAGASCTSPLTLTLAPSWPRS